MLQANLLLLLVLPLAGAHPQCLDSAPPFYPASEPRLCKEYKDFSCCSKGQDIELEAKYNDVVSWMRTAAVPPECEVMVKQVLCLTCNPYAAHLFDAEGKPNSRDIGGMCGPYCKEFYNKCQAVIGNVTADGRFLAAAQKGSDEFCDMVEIPDKDYCYPDIITNDRLNFPINRDKTSTSNCLCVQEIAAYLRNPLIFRVANDGTDRLFIGEQRGVIWIYYREKSRNPRPFLNFEDIDDKILTSDRKGDERGFLGLEFHPRFKDNGLFYIFYSLKIDTKQHVRISEMTVSSKYPNRANLTSERTLLTVFQPWANHNGGELLFDDEGYLLISLGDGGKSGDPLGNGQNTKSLLGKILRIDVDAQASGKPYGIPPNNPFVGDSNFLPEIYAYGTRNTWRCGKDPGDRKTGAGKGRIICGDVGQNKYEELDLLQAGGNYGWNAKEGSHCFNSSSLCNSLEREVLPIHDYPHAVGKSVTGGHFYRGCDSPNLDGLYIYGDFHNGKIFGLKEKRGGGWENKELKMCSDELCPAPYKNDYVQNILSFGQDKNGEVYMLSAREAINDEPRGSVYWLVDPTRRLSPGACNGTDDDDKTSSAPAATSPTSESSASGLQRNFYATVGMIFCSYFMP